MSIFRNRKTGELTGHMVLLWLVAFFVAVFAVNAVLVRAAISTFGGVETTSSYKAGQQFEREVATAERQAALHWKVAGTLLRDAAGEAVLNLSARDADGGPLSGLTAKALLAHPTDQRLDHVIALEPTGAGEFRGRTPASSGQWELIVDVYRDTERVYRSRSRVTLR